MFLFFLQCSDMIFHAPHFLNCMADHRIPTWNLEFDFLDFGSKSLFFCVKCLMCEESYQVSY